MSRGKRERLEEGIFRDRSGVAAVVKVGTVQREKRFPLEYDRDRIRQWRAQTRAELLGDIRAQKARTDDPRSLLRAVVTYLKRRKGRPGARADRSHLKAWTARLGTKRRHLITKTDVELAIATWLEAGVSAKTIRHRARVLRELYQTLDGGGGHPLQGVVLPKLLEPHPIPIPHAVIERAASSLAKGLRHQKGYGSDPIKSRARFLVYATTGQRPAQIGQALPGDVDLEARIWFVRPAKGGKPIPLPLNDAMMLAWQCFIAANAWGRFDTSSLAKLLRRHGWPTGTEPYQLRHTFAIDLLKSGVELGDIQGLLGHASIQTTRRFYAPILLSRLTTAVNARQLTLESASRTSASQTLEKTRKQERKLESVKPRPIKVSPRKKRKRA
jgi:integrase